MLTPKSKQTSLTQRDVLSCMAKVLLKEKETQLLFLEGKMGSGKTHFAKHLLSMLNISNSVVSPTFSIMECYPHESLSCAHLDFYRLQHESEITTLGLDIVFDSSAIILIEWASRFAHLLPKPQWTLHFSIDETTKQYLVDVSQW